jgi:hypothetical protein
MHMKLVSGTNHLPIWSLWYISVCINCIILVQLVMHIIAGHSQNQAWNMVQALSWCCENSSWWIVALTSIDPGMFKFDDGVYTCYGVRMLYIRSGLLRSSFSLAIYFIHSNANINGNTTILYCVWSVSDGRLQPAFFASLVKHPYNIIKRSYCFEP